MRVLGKDHRGGGEIIFKEIMAENWWKNKKSHIQETQVLSRINKNPPTDALKRNYNSPKSKRKIFKATREKSEITHQGMTISRLLNSKTETRDSRTKPSKDWMKITVNPVFYNEWHWDSTVRLKYKVFRQVKTERICHQQTRPVKISKG